MLTIKDIRNNNPVILNVANMVTPQHVADAINFIGGSPIMFTDHREAKGLTQLANGVVFNLGSTSENDIKCILNSGIIANESNTPVVVDPVAVGATELRKKNFNQVQDKIHIDILRGNAGEIAAVDGQRSNSKGIDAGKLSEDPIKLAQSTAKKYHTIVVLSGASDTVSDGNTTYQINNGHPYFKTNVGAGDMLDGILGVAAAIDYNIDSIARGDAILSVAGEIAGKKTKKRPASFMNEVFNVLGTLDDETFKKYIKIIKNN